MSMHASKVKGKLNSRVGISMIATRRNERHQAGYQQGVREFSLTAKDLNHKCIVVAIEV